MSWQHLKTGYSERSLFKQDQVTNPSSSLGFAIDCLNSSNAKGNLLFIDLRNRTVQRREVQEEKKEKCKKDLHAEMTRKAKENIAAEMAQLEKGWQCHRVSAFANQCWKGLMRLLPRTFQLKHLLKITRKQINIEKDKKESQLDDKEKTVKEKKATTEVKNKKRIGEERIQEAKIVWLKDCKRIMHAVDDAAAKAKSSTTDTANKREQQKQILEDLVKSLIKDCGAKACDTLDVCTVSFFREVCSME